MCVVFHQPQTCIEEHTGARMGPFATFVQQWEAYCMNVERHVRGDDLCQNTQTIFGVCRRCGSNRLLVTTRQLRRADEGMTAWTLLKKHRARVVYQKSDNVRIVVISQR